MRGKGLGTLWGAAQGSTQEPWAQTPCLSHPRKPSAISGPWVPQPQTGSNSEQRSPSVTSVLCAIGWWAVLPLVLMLPEAGRREQLAPLSAVGKRPPVRKATLDRPNLPPPVSKSVCPVPPSPLSSCSTALAQRPRSSVCPSGLGMLTCFLFSYVSLGDFLLGPCWTGLLGGLRERRV